MHQVREGEGGPVGEQQGGQDQAHLVTLGGAQGPVQDAAAQGEDHEEEQPQQVGGTKQDKAHPGGDGLGGVEQVLYGEYPPERWFFSLYLPGRESVKLEMECQT